jgi:hypothetical protein
VNNRLLACYYDIVGMEWDYTTARNEWLGVTVAGSRSRQQHDIIMASTITAFLACVMLCFQYLLPIFASPMRRQFFAPNVFWAAFLVLIVVGWLGSFARQKLLSVHGSEITFDTEMGPGGIGEAITDFAYLSARPARSAMHNMAIGRIYLSPVGIGGIVSIRWKQIRSITLLKPGTVQIIKKEVPFNKIARFLGFNPIFLGFKTPDDATTFVDATETGGIAG